jgi:putative ABC transport system substrate-binding protein
MRRRDFVAAVCITALWPIAAKAQLPAKHFRVGYLALTPAENVGLMKVLVDRLRELGWVEGQNLTIEYRSAEGDAKRLPGLATQLVETKPDVLVGGTGTLAPQALKAATTTIPVIFAAVGDPLGAKLVASLSRPEGNVTGLSSQVADLGGKRLEILRDLLPLQPGVAILLNPETPYTALALKEIATAAEPLKLKLIALRVTSGDQLRSQFQAARAAKASAMIVLEDPLTFSLRRQIAELAVEHRMPILSGDRQLTDAGGLISYGPDRAQIFQRAAEYVDKILRQTAGSSGAAAHQIRAGDQSEDRKGARARHSADAARPC